MTIAGGDSFSLGKITIRVMEDGSNTGMFSLSVKSLSKYNTKLETCIDWPSRQPHRSGGIHRPSRHARSSCTLARDARRDVFGDEVSFVLVTYIN